MTDVAQFKSDPQNAIFTAAENAPAVMLGNPAQGRTFQPMSPKVDREAGVLRFFASADSDLYAGLDHGEAAPQVVCIITGKAFDLFASVEGELVDVTAEALIEQHWDTVTEAWFENGKEDDKVRLLEFRPKQAAAWASTDDQACFSWEIDKAAGSQDTPDVGARLRADFTAHRAA
jgi:general stress protein 26